MAKKYDVLAKEILEKVGGEVNVANVMHCHTRLRFNLKDNSIIDLEDLKSLKVVGAQFSGEQLQIIIGPEVSEVYNEFIKLTGGVKEEQINENLENKPKQKRTVKGMLSAGLDNIVGSIVPVLPILIASGIIKAIVLILTQMNLISADSPSVTTLSFVADATFYFLPVFVGFFAAKKFGANMATGALIGAALIHPTFVGLVNEGVAQSIFGIPIYNTNYSSTIIPVILSVWVMSIIEKWISRFSPKSLRVILVPTLTLLIMIPMTFSVLAPLGAILSGAFGELLMFVDRVFGVFGIAIFAAVVPWVIMTGMHLGVIPISLQSIATAGIDKLVLPAFLISNIAQGAACLAVGVKTKDSDLKSFAFSSAFSCIIPGISEPAMYGITLRYKTPMWASMFGSAVGGLYFGIMGAGILSFLNPNIFAITGYVGTGVHSSNLMHALIGLAIAFVVTFATTLFIYKPKES